MLMPPSPPATKVRCPGCGQKLSVPNGSETNGFACPRCNRRLTAVDGNEGRTSPTSSMQMPLSKGGNVERAFHYSPVRPTPSNAHGRRTATQASLKTDTTQSPSIRPPDSAEPTETFPPGVPTPGMVTRAVDIGHRSLVKAGEGVGAMATMCARIDDQFQPQRSAITSAVTLGAGIAPILDAMVLKSDHLAITWFASTAFILTLGIMTIARLGSLRDENGAWTWDVASRRLTSILTSAIDSVLASFSLDSERRMLLLSRGVMSLAVFLLAVESSAVCALELAKRLAAVSTTIAPSTIEHFEENLGLAQGATTAGFALAALLFLSSKLRLSQGLANRKAGTEPLPLLIDCNDPQASRDFAMRASNPTMGAVIAALVDWKPRRHAHEDGYQASLERFLNNRFPELQPEREHRLACADGSTTLRVDFLLTNDVLIEMKRALTTSTLQKSIGQVEMYMQAWKRRGPLLLLLCDTRPEMASDMLIQSIQRLRQLGDVSVVLARSHQS